MTTSTARKQRTITLTHRLPVKIYEDEWPVIAAGAHEDYDGQYRFNSFRSMDISIHVRQHADGRTLVYAVYIYRTAYQNDHGRNVKLGWLLAPGEDVPAAIRQLGSSMVDRLDGDEGHVWDVVDECIADLPAEDL